MYIFGNFHNEEATVEVTIKQSSDGTAVVDGATCTHVGNGLYKYDFADINNSIDYYLVFNNTTDGLIAKGSIPHSMTCNDGVDMCTKLDSTHNMTLILKEAMNALDEKIEQASLDEVVLPNGWRAVL